MNIPNFSKEGPLAAEESYGSNSYCASEGGVPTHPAVDEEEVESALVLTVEELVDRLFSEDLSELEDLDDDDMYEPLTLTVYYPPSNPSGMD